MFWGTVKVTCFLLPTVALWQLFGTFEVTVRAHWLNKSQKTLDNAKELVGIPEVSDNETFDLGAFPDIRNDRLKDL